MCRFQLVLLAMVSFFCAGASFAQELPSDGPRPYVEESLLPSASPEGVVVLSQADPRWADLSLGSGTVRSQGCLFISVAMIAMELGLVTDPLSMMRSFVMNGLFSPSGLLRTVSIERVFPGLRVLMRRALSATGLDQVNKHLRAGHQVLLKIDRDLRRAGIQEHWVRVVRGDGGDLVVADPNGGRVATLRSLYGSSSVVREMLVLG